MGDKKTACAVCAAHKSAQYYGKTIRTITDRIDLQINVQSIEYNEIEAKKEKFSSQDLYMKVVKQLINKFNVLEKRENLTA